MLTRTIGLLANCKVFDRIVVSTDDEEIAAIGRAAGAAVPFMRPAALADDVAGTVPVIKHAILELDALDIRAEYLCCVYPAAVLSTAADLRKAWELLDSSDVDYVFTSTSFPYPIQRALRRTSAGRCEMFWPEHLETRSQDLEPAYHDAGQFYFGRRAAWMEGRPPFGPRALMLELPRWRVQDIDLPEDWDRAEMIYRLLQQTAHV
jgi:N-acylneuraminate cytidylyltransferase